MTLENNPYFQRYKEEFRKRKDLEVLVEKLQNKLKDTKDLVETAKFHNRENVRYQKGLTHLRKAYDDLLCKAEFLENAHQKLINLFNKYWLLDENVPNVKLSEQSKTEIIKETRLIILEEKRKYPIGKTYIHKQD